MPLLPAPGGLPRSARDGPLQPGGPPAGGGTPSPLLQQRLHYFIDRSDCLVDAGYVDL
ncbi:MAG: hypothetical protein NVV74_11560 [Magnetospirillum sp.]|nr:hypothetical protein [Magnetospirillum sp.]